MNIVVAIIQKRNYMKYYYTEKEHKEMLSHLVVVCTTNEQKNDHIKGWFDSKGIKWEDRALMNGDYNIKLEAYDGSPWNKDIYFTDEIFIERKNSLDELATSINNETFHYELKRSQHIPNKYLICEAPDGWNGIIAHKYRSKYNEKSFWNTMVTFCNKYKIIPIFVDKEHSAKFIYALAQNVVNNMLVKGKI